MHWCNQGTMDLFWKYCSTKFTGMEDGQNAFLQLFQLSIRIVSHFKAEDFWVDKLFIWGVQDKSVQTWSQVIFLSPMFWQLSTHFLLLRKRDCIKLLQQLSDFLLSRKEGMQGGLQIRQGIKILRLHCVSFQRTSLQTLAKQIYLEMLLS